MDGGPNNGGLEPCEVGLLERKGNTLTICCGREEAGFSQAQEESSNDESLVSSHDPHQRHDQAPGEAKNGNPDRRSQNLEDDVGRNLPVLTWSRAQREPSPTCLEQGVRNEEDRQRRIIAHPVEVEVFRHAGDFGIPDIASIDVCETATVNAGLGL